MDLILLHDRVLEILIGKAEVFLQPPIFHGKVNGGMHTKYVDGD